MQKRPSLEEIIYQEGQPAKTVNQINSIFLKDYLIHPWVLAITNFGLEPLLLCFEYMQAEFQCKDYHQSFLYLRNLLLLINYLLLVKTQPADVIDNFYNQSLSFVFEASTEYITQVWKQQNVNQAKSIYNLVRDISFPKVTTTYDLLAITSFQILGAVLLDDDNLLTECESLI